MTTATKQRERPILFSGPMVWAILEGRKTQTRRVVKPQPEAVHPCHWVPSGWAHARHGGCSCDEIRCPYGRPGDLLYVREAFAEVPVAGGGTDFVYAADYTDGSDQEAGVRYKPSIFMPKAVARLWLRVTDVRVERVQEITTADVWAEGVQAPTSEDGGVLQRLAPSNAAGKVPASYLPEGRCFPGQPPLTEDEIAMSHFADLWDSINADRGHPWESNPWVWVVSFERTEAP